jgi:hypothetical protein
MSAHESPPAALPSAGDGGGSGPDGPGDGRHEAMEAAGPGTPALALATADLANLLAHGKWGDGSTDAVACGPDANAYEGHVALALDTGVLPDIDSTLDLLTSSPDLFDVPALDLSSGQDGASSA